MADALVTCNFAGRRHVLLVERGDGLGWAVPGGSVDLGETPAHAAARELLEETGLRVPGATWQVGVPEFVPDPRGSDEAWAVTVVARADLGMVPVLPPVTGADDARRAVWVPAVSYLTMAVHLGAVYRGAVFGAHVSLLRRVLGPGGRSERRAGWCLVCGDPGRWVRVLPGPLPVALCGWCRDVARVELEDIVEDEGALTGGVW
ncbi:MAG: NUDIX domain-containing protein [Dermatophilaceae bacterium]